MPEFLAGSLVISLCMKILNAFVAAYKNSILNSFLSGFGICFKQSRFRRVLSAYVYKNPWFRYSLVFRIIMFFVKVFDKIFGFIYCIIKKCIFGSKVVNGCRNTAKMSLTDKCYCAGVLLISMPIGAMLAAIVFNSVSVMTMVLSWTIFVVGVMTVLVGVYGKDSIVVKLIRGFIAAIR